MPRPSPFRWNAKAARYQDRAGRFVPAATVRAASDAVIAGVRGQIDALTARLLAGTLTGPEWEQAMRTNLKALHLAQLAAGAGGWAQLTPTDFGHVGQTLRGQYRYLARFATQIAAGQLSPAQIAARARLYADAARATYEAARLRSDRTAGCTQERNVLHPAEHCADCLTETARGWVPLGTLLPIGGRICRVHDQCSIERR